jgi:hypothetical protein
MNRTCDGVADPGYFGQSRGVRRHDGRHASELVKQGAGTPRPDAG